MRRTPSLSTIEAFLAAAEGGSFKSAADALCLSAPAITRRIQALERQSGASLFERRAGGVTLTEAGRDLAARIGPALDEVKAALRPAGDPRSPVRLRVSRSLAGLWLAPRLSRLPKDVTLDFRSDVTIETLLAGGADLGIFFDVRPEQATAEVLIPVEISVVSAPRLADGRPPPESVGGAVSFDLIGLSGQPWLWPRAERAARPSLTFDGVQAMYEAAASGLGLAPGFIPSSNRTSRAAVSWSSLLSDAFGVGPIISSRRDRPCARGKSRKFVSGCFERRAGRPYRETRGVIGPGDRRVPAVSSRGRRTTALTTTSTTMLRTSAAIPMFTSSNVAGRNGSRFVRVMCCVVVSATMPTPAATPAKAPALLTGLRGIRLAINAGKELGDEGVAHQQERHDGLAAADREPHRHERPDRNGSACDERDAIGSGDAGQRRQQIVGA